MFNGKTLWTEDTFNYASVKIGDYVEQAVVDNAMNCLPPASMTSECSQMGEPYSHREDPDTGKWRPTFATFKRITSGPDGVWEYCGHCFRGENVERGNDGYAEFRIKHNSVYILSDKAPRLVAPKGVKTTCQKSSMIKVSWNKVAGAAGYDIYR